MWGATIELGGGIFKHAYTIIYRLENRIYRQKDEHTKSFKSLYTKSNLVPFSGFNNSPRGNDTGFIY